MDIKMETSKRCEPESEFNLEELAAMESQTIRFLLRSLDTVKNCDSNSSVLRTTFLKRCGSFEAVRVPKGILRDSCKYCNQPWIEGNFKLKVLPKKVPGKGIRRIMRKNKKSPKSLTVFQKKLLLLAEKNVGNKLVLTCVICKKKMVKVMHKPQLLKELPYNYDKKEEGKAMKRKKKKKDVFAGLNSQVVLKVAGVGSVSHKPAAATFKMTNQKLQNETDTGKDIVNNEDRNKFSLSEQTKRQKSVKLKSQKGHKLSSPRRNVPEDLGALIQNTSKTVLHDFPVNKGHSFFRNLEENKRLEQQKVNDLAKQNRNKRKRLAQQMTKNKKPNITEFKDFLRDFGKPI